MRAERGLWEFVHSLLNDCCSVLMRATLENMWGTICRTENLCRWRSEGFLLHPWVIRSYLKMLLLQGSITPSWQTYFQSLMFAHSSRPLSVCIITGSVNLKQSTFHILGLTDKVNSPLKVLRRWVFQQSFSPSCLSLPLSELIFPCKMSKHASQYKIHWKLLMICKEYYRHELSHWCK